MIVLKNRQDLDNLLKEHNKCLIDFNTTWCGPCKMLRPELEKLEKLHPEWTVISIDAEQFPQLFEQCGASAVPTVLIWANGVLNTNDTITGFRPLAELEKIISKY